MKGQQRVEQKVSLAKEFVMAVVLGISIALLAGAILVLGAVNYAVSKAVPPTPIPVFVIMGFLILIFGIKMKASVKALRSPASPMPVVDGG